MELEEFKHYLLMYCNDKCLEFGRFKTNFYKGRCKSYVDIKRFVVEILESEKK